MTPRVCVQCGHPLPNDSTDGTVACKACGATSTPRKKDAAAPAEEKAPRSRPRRSLSRTLLGQPSAANVLRGELDRAAQRPAANRTDEAGASRPHSRSPAASQAVLGLSSEASPGLGASAAPDEGTAAPETPRGGLTSSPPPPEEPAAPAPPRAHTKPMPQTLLGLSSVPTQSTVKTDHNQGGAPFSPETQRGLSSPLPPQEAPAGRSLSPAQTIIGFPSGKPAPSYPPSPTAPPPGARPRPGTGHTHKTLLGMALPGIAPLNSDAAAAGSQAASPAPPRAKMHSAGDRTVRLQVAYVPPPPPLKEIPAPTMALFAPRRGLPLGPVAAAASGLVILLGATLFLIWGQATPISALPHVSAEGRDVLRLTCDPRRCRNGTVATIDNARATFSAGECELTLPSPLELGDNALRLALFRNGSSRAEAIKLVVSLSYRIHVDLSTMQGEKPAITVRVKARPATAVRIADSVVALDASGNGAYSLDESAATLGAAEQSRVISADIPYAVTPSGRAPERGTVTARVSVAPLSVDAPSMDSVVEEDSVIVAGRAAKGASVTVDGLPVTVNADGSFETSVRLDELGQRSFDVRSGTSALSPRTIRVSVTRVSKLAEAARDFEALGAVGYDDVLAQLSTKTHQPIVVDGKVLDLRVGGHRTMALVDDRRGCAKEPCYARVIIARDTSLTNGQSIRAYGHVARAFSMPGGQPVPEVEAEFAIVGKP